MAANFVNQYIINLKELKSIDIEDILHYDSNNESIQEEFLRTWLVSAVYMLRLHEIGKVRVFLRMYLSKEDVFDHSIIIYQREDLVVDKVKNSADPDRIIEYAAQALSIRLLQDIRPYNFIQKIKPDPTHTDFKYKPDGEKIFEYMEVSGTTKRTEFESRCRSKLKRIGNSCKGFVSVSFFETACSSQRFVRFDT